MDWRDYPSSVRIANITLPTSDVYQFAVSANTHEASSGMVWATCTILHDRVSCVNEKVKLSVYDTTTNCAFG